MVYECPQCKTALSPGSAACPNCGLKFETPTPADATLPPPEAAAPFAAPPPAYASALPGSDPVPAAPPLSPVRKAAVSVAGLIALFVLLVVVAIFAVKAFFQQETASNPPPAPTGASTPAPGPASAVALPPRTTVLSAPNAPPVTLAPGTAAVSSAAGGPDSTSLVGRWQSKNADYYVFSGAGSGAHGNQSDGRKELSFHWILADNQLILNGAKEEHLTYSSGPDANTMYLRSADGKYEAFTKTAAQ